MIPATQVSQFAIWCRLHKMTSHTKTGLKVLSPSVKSNTGSPLPEAASHTPVVPASRLNASKPRTSFETDQEVMSGSPSCAMTGSIPRWKARHRHRVSQYIYALQILLLAQGKEWHADIEMCCTEHFKLVVLNQAVVCRQAPKWL